MLLDTSFDFQTDAGGLDPDRYSPTLRRYHQALWSRTLPTGERFELVTTTPGVYLHHKSELGEFSLSSDSIIPTYTRWVRMRHIVERFSEEENAAFRSFAYTIGGMLVFPANRVDRQDTINMARGKRAAIADRMDLTLECIRLHYAGDVSPLSDVLARHADFFKVFRDFAGYVSFFLLQDLVTPDGESVRFLLPFDGFATSGCPKDVDSYRAYRERTKEFVAARNRRVADLAVDLP